MITDKLPRAKTSLLEYEKSDLMSEIELEEPDIFHQDACQLESALKEADQKAVRKLSSNIACDFSRQLDLPAPKISVLGARPLQVGENTQYELFGDYTPETMKIRLWMKTAVHQKPTAFGTFLSTLCHELCHHWDITGLDLPNTFHTRGFYNRAGLLYHTMRKTPPRKLVWDKLANGLYRINWPKTMRG